MSLLGGNSGKQRLGTRQPRGRPVSVSIVIFRDSGRVGWQDNPRLFRCGEDMYVGWQPVGFVQRTDPDEAHGWPGTRVVAPHRDSALGTPRDLLALAARGRRIHEFSFPPDQCDAVRLLHSVPGEPPP